MSVVMEMGLIHPPVGLNIFVINRIAPDIGLGPIIWGTLPFVGADGGGGGDPVGLSGNRSLAARPSLQPMNASAAPYLSSHTSVRSCPI